MLFNNTVKYSVEVSEEEVGGTVTKLRKAIVEFDDFWGKRRTYTILAPSDLWTEVKVGGTASTGDSPLAGVVTEVKLGSIFRTVWIPDLNSYVTVFKDVLYQDKDWTVGYFDRIEDMAQNMANELGKKVVFYSQSQCGSTQSSKYPNNKENKNG